MVGPMKASTALVLSILVSSFCLAAPGASLADEVRRSDYPFFNRPYSAPIRSGLAALNVSGSSGLSGDEWALLSAELAKKGAAVVLLADEGEEPPADAANSQDLLLLCADGPGRPSWEDVDAFVAFVRAQPKGRWIHVCGGADGGASTAFMAMADMMRNAGAVPFDDILDRQRLLGGSEMRRLGKATDRGWRDASRRRAFLRLFHEYARKNDDDFATPWSEWIGIKASHKGRR